MICEKNVEASSGGTSWSGVTEAKADLCGFEGARKGKRSGRDAEAGAERERSESVGGTEEKRESVEESEAARDLDNPIFPVTIA